MGYGCSAFSFIRVDVVHHQGYISLGQIIKAFSLRQDTADQFMIDFAGTFLIRTTRFRYP